jgi:hypothetical protein
MRGDFVTQVAYLGATAAFGHAIAQLAQLGQQRIYLLLLAVHQGVELVERVFGIRRFHLQIDQTVFDGLGNVHLPYFRIITPSPS